LCVCKISYTRYLTFVSNSLVEIIYISMNCFVAKDYVALTDCASIVILLDQVL